MLCCEEELKRGTASPAGQHWNILQSGPSMRKREEDWQRAQDKGIRMRCHLQEDTEDYKTAENSNLEHLEKEDGSFQAMRGQQTPLAIKKLRLGDGEMA